MLPPIPDLVSELWSLVRQIPHGRISTYGDVARALGDVGASRFVGEQMMNHDHQAGCCCYRLVRADGTLGKFVSGDVAEKAAQLQKDGIAVADDRVKSNGQYWKEFQSAQPLIQLSEYQVDVGTTADITSCLSWPEVVGGVDVSFVPNSDLAVAAFVEVNVSTGQMCYEKTDTAPIRFPYIPGFLAFRELPLLLKLLEKVRAERTLPSVTFVDGSGVLHPRRAGVATMLGVATGIATIGVTKKHLTGKVDLDGMTQSSVREIRVGDELRGFAVLTGSGTAKPIYVSPGHRIDPATAIAVLQQCRRGRRLPEPIYWADRISRAKAKRK